MGPAGVGEGGHQLPVNAVDGIVAHSDPPGGGCRVVGADRGGQTARLLGAQPAELAEGGAQPDRDHHGGCPQIGGGGDVVGELGHPLHRRGGAQPGHDQVQIPRDRILPGQQQHQVLVEVLAAVPQAGHSGVHASGVGLPGHRAGRVEEDLAGLLGEVTQHEPQTPQRLRVLQSAWFGNVHAPHRPPCARTHTAAHTQLPWRLPSATCALRRSHPLSHEEPSARERGQPSQKNKIRTLIEQLSAA